MRVERYTEYNVRSTWTVFGIVSCPRRIQSQYGYSVRCIPSGVRGSAAQCWWTWDVHARPHLLLARHRGDNAVHCCSVTRLHVMFAYKSYIPAHIYYTPAAAAPYVRITNLRRIGSITAAVVVIALHDDIIMYSLSRDRVGRNLKTARVRRFESADTAYNIILFCARGPGQDDRTEGRKRGREGVEGGGGKLRVHARSTFYIRKPVRRVSDLNATTWQFWRRVRARGPFPYMGNNNIIALYVFCRPISRRNN